MFSLWRQTTPDCAVSIWKHFPSCYFTFKTTKLQITALGPVWFKLIHCRNTSWLYLLHYWIALLAPEQLHRWCMLLEKELRANWISSHCFSSEAATASVGGKAHRDLLWFDSSRFPRRRQQRSYWIGSITFHLHRGNKRASEGPHAQVLWKYSSAGEQTVLGLIRRMALYINSWSSMDICVFLCVCWTEVVSLKWHVWSRDKSIRLEFNAANTKLVEFSHNSEAWIMAVPDTQ